MNDFEPIYAAFWSRVSGIGGLRSKSRRIKHWADVPAEQQPAMFMIQTVETPEQVRGLPPKWRLRGELYIYVNNRSQDEAPSQIMNPILGAVRDALQPDDFRENTCTLGGLVTHCWISGEIENHDGVLGDQAVAVVPFEIMTA